jgi:hypothetical protein
MIGLCFLLFALPCFLFVKERGNPNPRPVFGLQMVRESTRQTIATLRSGAAYPGPGAVPRRSHLLHRPHQHRDQLHDALTRSTWL